MTQSGNKAASALVLGSYPDIESGKAALRTLRHAGFGRAASVSGLPGGRVDFEGEAPSRLLKALVVAILAPTLLAISILLTSIHPLAESSQRTTIFILAVVVALAGRFLFLQHRFGVDSSILSRYGRWVTAGESLVIVQSEIHQSRSVLALLRDTEGTPPATFIIRPHNVIPGRVAEFQRQERFPTERLKLHAAWLAGRHAGAVRPLRPKPLWNRLRDCDQIVEAITLDLAQAVQLEQRISVSAEWLLDNAYIIQRQIADVRKNLSHQLYDVLPTLEGGPLQGQPRIYDVAAQMVVHTDSELAEDDIEGFLRAYQQVSPLTMSELWAFPLLLRLTLLESLSYLATRIDDQQHDFEWADFWANRLLIAARRTPDRLLFTLAELAREHPDPSTVFADRLVSQLQGESLALGPVLAWLELKWGQPVPTAIQQEDRRHSAEQATIANGIGSLRLLARLDWSELFENVSQIEEALRSESADIYRRMDFGTRDSYRHVIEEIARHSPLSELEVARTALELSTSRDGVSPGHVGYYLIDAGRHLLESRAGYHPTASQRLRLGIVLWPTAEYLGTIAIGTSLVLAILVALGAAQGSSLPHAAALAALCLLALVPASELVIQVVNFVVATASHPEPLPKLSFEEGVPDEWRTLVVVPTLLASPNSIQEDIEHLEIRFLADKDANLRFALLADLVDAPERVMPEDSSLVDAAVRGIDELNARYPGGQFVLFCRTRRWSETEQCWMGWERKRGKLEELNSWLLGEAGTSPDLLRPIAGDPSQLENVRFVLTLDADTQLPHGTARRLIGTLAHPLNRPRLTPDGRRVARGYTIIQPRVSPSLPSATATRFSRLFADSNGLDPYSRVVSDLYQDLSGEGSYYGKGIYDVETFHRILGGRFPAATLLSHDLLEGAYVKVGMATDIELFDAFPSSYLADTQRAHRWIRGDWQIASWCGNSVPTESGPRDRNPLGALNRWKLLDNLRRSLLPPTSVGLLLTTWLLVPELAALASLLIGLGLFLPPTLRLILWVPFQPRAVLASRLAWSEQGTLWLRTLIGAALLPHQTIITLDAIARTLYRRLVSHRGLLQWQTYRAGSRGAKTGNRRIARQMAIVSLASLEVGAVMLLTQSGAVAAATPFLLLWILSPAAVAWLGVPQKPRPDLVLSDTDRGKLRRTARETWRYFDDFVGPATNWLPPDNYQESPLPELAERTSPTNIGLWLLSTLAARDLGYITPDQVVERGHATMDTLERLERFEGHLLNWYDTRTTEPLLPRYVSTVDSGNLLASLWTLLQGYGEMIARQTIGPEALCGLQDTLAPILSQVTATAGLSQEKSPRRAGTLAKELSELLATPPDEPEKVVARLRAAVTPAHELVVLLEDRLGSNVAQPAGGSDASAAYWAAQLEGQLLAWTEVADRDFPSGQIDPARRAIFISEVERLIARVETFAGSMNMEYLYDSKRRLFTIGYNVSDRRFDTSYYDLLASEARIASIVSIAQGSVPAEHWFALGRTFGKAQGHRVLFSWSGTMFEYLMPLLITRTYPHTLLRDALREAVGLQIDYGRQQGVPWGISESAFAATDVNQIYQYQAFGVPGLGLKRGLSDDLVVAPYATALASMVDLQAALANYRWLDKLGLRGNYGYYESIDYTRRRQPKGGHGIVVQTYMVHHQGMTLLALNNVLNAGIMQERFHCDPRIRAVEPLLFEQTPVAPMLVEAIERGEAPLRLSAAAPVEVTAPLDAAAPATQLLGNGSYTSMVTSTGGGFTHWRGVDITRWRADTTLDGRGQFCYVRDMDRGMVWSTTYQPVGKPASRYLTRFSSDRVEFERRDFGVGVTTEIAVSPEDDVEVRYLTVANYSNRPRRLEFTSYAELALAPHGADLVHPAFSKMFVVTETLPDENVLLASRKPRAPEDNQLCAFHLLASPTAASVTVPDKSYETDRARFVGRGRSLENPIEIEGDLSCSAGSVLDPIFSLRCELTLDPGQRLELAFVTGAAENRAAALGLVEKYSDLHTARRALEAATRQGQSVARQLGVTADDLRRFQQLAGPLLYPTARLRASERQLRRNRLGQAGLWAHGISGDLPILLVTLGDRRDMAVVREALLAHAYWRLLGFRSDLVILNEEASGYEQPLQADLKRVIQRHAPYTPLDEPGGIFLRPAEKMPEDDLALLFAAARVVLVAARGDLVQQLAIHTEAAELPPPQLSGRRITEEPSAQLPFLQLPYFNGLGGFTPDGREYAAYLGPGTQTPAPWVNVLANPSFGALVSESGSGFCWAGNSQANRLTPWSNDPVLDSPGEALYIRDEQLGVFWTPTAAPIRELDAYRARHGQGYTIFEHNSHALEQELVTFVPMDQAGGAPVRVQRLRLRNRSSHRRRLSIFSYLDWVLGTSREDTQMHVVTSWDAGNRTLLARNSYHPDFPGHVAFVSASPVPQSHTADRTEFLGRNGSYARPAALLRKALSGQTGAGFDPCAALQVVVEIDPGQDAEVTFLMGEATDAAEVQRLVEQFLDPIRVDQALQETRSWWDQLLESVQVETPDLAINFLLNRWLLYQTLSCRIWARSAFYQSGGAVGFRDQLQDCLALLYAAPDIARRQILVAAARQFVEGDVQHWWHPQTGGGVRTRISDDLLWLPYATAQYVRVTGDTAILDEIVPFLEGRELADGEHEAYFAPTVSLHAASLLDHCRSAIGKGLTAGRHGLPLMGTGDWNDGMNRVGAGGQGESIWLAWFTADVLRGLAKLLQTRGEDGEAQEYRDRADSLAAAVENHGWDGEWYLRAYFDDGTPLGSHESEEAKIDSLPQSWAAISGAANPVRADRAMRAVEEQLVRPADGLVLLFTPPFEKSALDPGYIKGYPAGVRENGGQYTHAALWVAMALARQGKGDRAVAVLRMLNPVEHTRTPEAVERYRIEPYVVSADVYSLEGKVGQGGWSWYTGSAGWMYRVWIEEVLGFKLRGDLLRLDPTIPSEWPGFALRYRFRSAQYDIRVENPDQVERGIAWVELDGRRESRQEIALQDDGRTHTVVVRLGLGKRMGFTDGPEPPPDI